MAFPERFEFQFRLEVFLDGLIGATVFIQGIGLLDQIVDADKLIVRFIRPKQWRQEQHKNAQEHQRVHARILTETANPWQPVWRSARG